jgi:hypothetical protein
LAADGKRVQIFSIDKLQYFKQAVVVEDLKRCNAPGHCVDALTLAGDLVKGNVGFPHHQRTTISPAGMWG